MGELSGKIALITDGNSGIGLESARVFIEEGARVFLTERNRETLDAGARSVGSQAITIRRTQKTSREIDKLFAAIAGQVDGLDILFVNAGVGRATPLGQAPEAVFDELFAVNVKGVFFTVQAALPLLKP